MELTKQQVSDLKKSLIESYKKAGLKNCLGSVEKVVNELFDCMQSPVLPVDTEVIKKSVVNAIIISDNSEPYYIQITKSGHAGMYNVIYEDPNECIHEFLTRSELLQKHPSLINIDLDSALIV